MPKNSVDSPAVSELFVSPDGPLASLRDARDQIRILKNENRIAEGGLTVWVKGGDYLLHDTFELSEEDSGTEDRPIVYRACEGETVRLLGGRLVDDFTHVTDSEILERLSSEAREHVLRADLGAHGITDFGQLRSRGFGRTAVPAHLELFLNGEPMTLARYPNDDFLKIAGDPEDCDLTDGHGGKMWNLETGFSYDDDRPEQWKTLKNVWVHGYWGWDWANSFEEIDTLDLERRHIKTKPPHGNYGFRLGHRFYFLNVLDELDAPGEYYVDTEQGILYFWPPEPVENTEVLVSVLERPMVTLEDVSHVTLRGLTFEATRGDVIRMSGGRKNLIAGCTFRNIGSQVITIKGGEAHGVVSCDAWNIGDGAIRMSGGDRKTLTPCGHFARNNHVHHFGRWSRCYTPAISFSGVGFRISHNLIHDAPHIGIIYTANESVIELNEIHHVTMETGDCGSIYTGRDYTARGNVIRHNYIHDTGGYGMGSMAIYLDDCVSGQTIYGNIFARTTRAAFIGGGREVAVENNIFVDCVPAIHVDGRGLSKSEVWHNMIYDTMKERLDEMRHHEPPYSERYPELAELDAFYERDDGVPPGNLTVARNICVGGQWLDIRWGATEEHVTFGENLVDGEPAFVDAGNDDYRLQDSSPAWQMGFKPIPVEEIGLVEDEFRPRAQ